MFVESNPYKIPGFTKMYHRCPHCNVDFERETGFYYGAMYVSYALTVIISVLTAIIWYFLFRSNLVLYIIINFAIILVLFPLLYRISRSIWISIFVRFDEKFQ